MKVWLWFDGRAAALDRHRRRVGAIHESPLTSVLDQTRAAREPPLQHPIPTYTKAFVIR